MDYKKEIKLNKYRLDDEVEKQAYNYLYYADLYAEKKKEVNEVKNKLTVTKAKCELPFRSNPPEGLKITESVITSLVVSHPYVEKVESELTKAYYELDQLGGIVEAFRQKKSMINDLVQLYAVNYWTKQGGDVKVKSLDEVKSYQDDALLDIV